MKTEQNWRTAGTLVKDTLDYIWHVKKPYPTGYTMLDRRLDGGFHKEDGFVIIGARPNVGKTSFMIGVAVKAVKSGFPTAIFSLEMSFQGLMQRVLAYEAKVDHSHVRMGLLQNDEQQRLEKAGEKVSLWPLYVDDSPALSTPEIKGRASYAVENFGVKCVFIDYIQLIRGSRETKGSRYESVTEISNQLKTLPKQLGVPVVGLCQLNREREGNNTRPDMSKLRDSGALEQDADVVILIHRDSYYQRTNDANVEIIVDKQRNGPTGTVHLKRGPEGTIEDVLEI